MFLKSGSNVSKGLLPSYAMLRPGLSILRSLGVTCPKADPAKHEAFDWDDYGACTVSCLRQGMRTSFKRTGSLAFHLLSIEKSRAWDPLWNQTSSRSKYTRRFKHNLKKDLRALAQLIRITVQPSDYCCILTSRQEECKLRSCTKM